MLIPCEACNRHVRATDARCPFCGATITAIPVARSRFEGRLSRAAVFASAVLIAPGCIVQNPPPNYQQQQVPPPPPPPPDDGQHTEFSRPPSDPPDPRPEPTGRVHGHVSDTNGRPQARAVVDLVGAQRFRAITDDDGRYSIAGVPAGQYTVVVGGRRARVIETAAGEDHLADVAIAVAPERIRPYDRSNIPKPYGAPPARKRVV